MTDLDGNPVRDEQGNQVYRYDLDDEIATLASAVVQDIRQAFIVNNPQFEGNNWHATKEIAAVPQPPAGELAQGQPIHGPHRQPSTR